MVLPLYFLSVRKTDATVISAPCSRFTDQKQATSAAAFGWIVTPENHKITQLRAGRAFERVHLTATFLGLSLQPMNHILHTYNDMKKTRHDFQEILDIPDTNTLQMFFRIGYARSAPYAPRRNIENIIE
jgi:hypothetical protein